ncbi:MAG: stage II sporulation protein M [Candidatus Woesearchaeota archaeon]
MVLEGFISAENAESKPWLLLFWGFVYTSVAMLLAYWIFKEYSSLFTVFLATVASLPIIFKLMKLEEQKDLTDMSEKILLKEHAKALSSFMYLFLGAVLAFTLWYLVLPTGVVAIIYEAQTSTISSINGKTTTSNTQAAQVQRAEITGNTLGVSKGSLGIEGKVITPFEAFKRIFFNNVKVLIFCLLFSFIYGAGAIFILLWNASVIGTAIGNFIRTQLATLAIELGGVSLGNYFSVVSLGLFKYAIHGIPEILAYFVGALAGGIISIAIINHDFSSQKFEHIVLDSADLVMLSLVILFVAALLEVYVTPVIFG